MCKNLKFLMVGLLAALFVAWACVDNENIDFEQPTTNKKIDLQTAKKFFYQQIGSSGLQNKSSSQNAYALSIVWDSLYDDVTRPHSGYELVAKAELNHSNAIPARILFYQGQDSQIDAKVIYWHKNSSSYSWDNFKGLVITTDINGMINDIFTLENHKFIARFKTDSDVLISEQVIAQLNKQLFHESQNKRVDLDPLEITVTPQPPPFTNRPLPWVTFENEEIDIEPRGGGGGSSSNDGDTPQPDPDENPCDEAREIVEDYLQDQKIKDTNDHRNSSEENKNLEWGHDFDVNGNIGDRIEGNTGTVSGSVSIPQSDGTKIGYVHWHPQNGSPMFSILDLHHLYANHIARYNGSLPVTFFMAVYHNNGAGYLVTLDFNGDFSALNNIDWDSTFRKHYSSGYGNYNNASKYFKMLEELNVEGINMYEINVHNDQVNAIQGGNPNGNTPTHSTSPCP